ncbi:hypothetical protein HAX54_040481, partial [Datura stramonium]|nr:hypothetical protein [Datura stramonium]
NTCNMMDDFRLVSRHGGSSVAPLHGANFCLFELFAGGNLLTYPWRKIWKNCRPGPMDHSMSHWLGPRIIGTSRCSWDLGSVLTGTGNERDHDSLDEPTGHWFLPWPLEEKFGKPKNGQHNDSLVDPTGHCVESSPPLERFLRSLNMEPRGVTKTRCVIQWVVGSTRCQ